MLKTNKHKISKTQFMTQKKRLKYSVSHNINLHEALQINFIIENLIAFIFVSLIPQGVHLTRFVVELETHPW